MKEKIEKALDKIRRIFRRTEQCRVRFRRKRDRKGKIDRRLRRLPMATMTLKRVVEETVKKRCFPVSRQ